MEDGSSTYLPVSNPWSYISHEDKAALDGQPLWEIQRRSRDMIKRHQDYMIALSTIHNAASPIHALLPPELLINIFAILPIEDLRDARLTLVCRRWRDLLLRTPEFWANLLAVIRHQDIKDDFLATMSQRSYPRRLSLNMGIKLLQAPQFAPHLIRISSLRVDVIGGWYERLHELLKQRRLPTLESLTVDLFIADGPKLTEMCRQLGRCTDDDLPCLRHLRIPGELFAFLYSITQLKSLVISRLEYLPDFTALGYTASLVSAIRRCTTLQTLRVESLPGDGWEDIEQPQSDSVPVPFPDLRVLEIVLSHDHAPLANVLQHLVQHIVPPHGARIRLVSGRTDSPISIMLPAYPLTEKPHGKIVVYVDVTGAGPLTLTVLVDNRELVEVKVTPPGQETDIPPPEPITASLVRYMRFIMQQYVVFIQDINTLEVHYGLNRSITREDIRLLLGLSPSLKSLTLHGWLPSQYDAIDNGDGPENQQDLLGALCTTSQPDGDIPCPSLRELDFICEGPMPPAKILAARIAAVLSAREAVSATRLDLFTLQGYPRDAAAEASGENDITGELVEVVRPLVDTLKLTGDVSMEEDA
ncbi:hypothetical protein OH76DRAFT_1399475 [Lentinus brumalis]|uniref:F-box domain-containing protein n=1 Tax=Lentinus brumalis TaxID=2498619 RepID=A0A371DLZ6_9APHY|nr:hypothetical protein OH76DRAFT_1399475 [Polyporus brumalis]